MKKSNPIYNLQGFTLIELSMVLALAGSLMVLVVNYSKSAYLESSAEDEIYLVQQVNDAIEGYAFKHNHLPCPATNREGQAPDECENLSGFVPFQSLGLPSEFGSVIYNVTAQSNITKIGADRLSIVKFSDSSVKAKPLLQLAKIGYEGTDFYKGRDSYYDFCTALKGTVDNSAAEKKIAIYSLEFQKLTFNHMYFTNGVEMYNNFNCQSLLANASRSHVNVALAADIMYRAASDFYEYEVTKLEVAEQDLKIITGQLSLRLTNATLFKMLPAAQALLNFSSTSTSSWSVKTLQSAEYSAQLVNYATYVSQIASRFWILSALDASLQLQKNNKTRIQGIKDQLKLDKDDFNIHALRSIYEGLGVKPR